MAEGTSRIAESRMVKVWDVPTRLFHWLLIGLILVCWFTGEEEGVAGELHTYAGEAIAGLLVFRIIWGFVGGEHARFSDFAAGPDAIFSHVRALFSPQPPRHLGHNPLGGLAVLLLLTNVAVIVVAGLFSSGEGRAGPFAGMWGLELSEVHEIAFRVLQGLAVLHILGVVIETVRTRDALVPAMITGRKRRAGNEPGADASQARFGALVIAVWLGAAAAFFLIAQPHSVQPNVEHDQSGRD